LWGIGVGGKMAFYLFTPDGTPMGLWLGNDKLDKPELILQNALDGSRTELALNDLVLSDGVRSWAAFSPDSQVLAVQFGDGTIILWNRDGSMKTKLSESIQVYNPVYVNFGILPWVIDDYEFSYSRVVYSPDGKLLASGLDDGTVHLYRLEDGSKIALDGHRGPISRVRFSPDGRLLASISTDGTIRLWGVLGN
jgi:WD40 repeat protein